ncbi:NADPH-dependent F420 reductase [Yinghuangia seranimata]|uniref:NADPH-dependent F420 reductase n=1 Tax=Yinghuangia seranimata TaxID=408067 RepID=UPI00248AC66D|nr:NAD(P)-binding domain-containing protein [Yinghuangia seranimata]MDI2131109.1 NAD(P)-binding domain-containing protein [Yinghuangia seranimata]
MSTLGLIGSGKIGGTLARLAVDAGWDVVLSNSRGPETLADLAADLGPRARAGTVGEAAAAGDLVVVTVPVKAYPTLPDAGLAGKTVIDTGNYYPQRDEHLPELTGPDAITSAELLQRRLASAHVVKLFNTIYFAHLATLGRPAHDPRRSALPLAGDDKAAKEEAAAFADALGYDTVDTGPLAEGRRFEPGSVVYNVYGDGPFTAGRLSAALEL